MLGGAGRLEVRASAGLEKSEGVGGRKGRRKVRVERREEENLYVCVCICVCLHEWRLKVEKGKGKQSVSLCVENQKHNQKVR